MSHRLRFIADAVRRTRTCQPDQWPGPARGAWEAAKRAGEAGALHQVCGFQRSSWAWFHLGLRAEAERWAKRAVAETERVIRLRRARAKDRYADAKA
eukprot:10649777-Alexandrium_andersonii.AAC.1